MSQRFASLFPSHALIGVVHLMPLPGSPDYGGSMAPVIERAAEDATALTEGGFDGIIVENFGDAPFYPDSVPPITISAMTVCAMAVAERIAKASLSPVLGLNVLRNDAEAALAIATAVGASFIRVNVHTGAMITDQGLIQGQAHHTLRQRSALGMTNLAILTDILVKHASPLGTLTLEDAARDTWKRGGSDALIVSGAGTGLKTDPQTVATVRRAAPDAPILIGSGTTLDTLSALLLHADAAIIGTALKVGNSVHGAVDVEKVAKFVETRNAN